MKTEISTNHIQNAVPIQIPSPTRATLRAALVQALHHVELTAPEYVLADVLTDDLFAIFCEQLPAKG